MIDPGSKQTHTGANPNIGESESHEKNEKIIRLIKTVVTNPETGKFIDESVIKYKYYNSFNYFLLSRDNQNVNLTLGITSAKLGEGKTLISCNMAVSFAMGSQKKTILVDLNVANPNLHRIFGVPLAPGLTEGLISSEINVSRTMIENLDVLTAGSTIIPHENLFANNSIHEDTSPVSSRAMLGLDQLAAFRDLIYSLEQHYELIIVDMPAINSVCVPTLFANQLHGLVVVVHSGKTKKEEVDAIFQRINERQVLGFVLNRFDLPQEHH
ncbi:MAG: CpsD/CapB family tyrosine-protein kinase [Ignavibacteriales bacterium]|nr:CpsD/CapB family tyrosine-protein kinase [Ignavibacteriales bacterium]